jgi:hypothetical protein
MHRSHTCFCWLCVALGTALAFLLFFGAPRHSAAQPKGPVSFINDVAPILRESCFGCHGVKNPKAKFDMTKYETFMKGGIHEDPIDPGKPEKSLVMQVLKAKDSTRMPPKENSEALAPAKIAVLEQWIKEGAKLDNGIARNADLLKELRNRWKPPTPFAAYPFPVQINALAFTPDNKKVVASGHHELTVWDIDTGKLEKRIYTRCRRAMAMLFLPDGKLAVAGGRPGEEGDVRIYDINAAGKTENGVTVLDGVNDPKVTVAKLLEADDEVQCLALSADGKKLAAGGCDRIVYVWDLSAGYDKAKLEQSIENHADWVFAVAFSPDGKQLLTCSRDKTAKVWDLTTKESVLTFPDHQNSVTGVGVKADGKVGFSAGADGQLRAWNTSGDQAGKAAKGAAGNHAKPILKLVQHPKLPLMATCSEDMTVKLWNTDTGAALKTLSGHTDQVFAVAISPDGNLVASGTWNGEVKVWKVADGTVARAINASPGLVVAPVPPK